MTHPVYDQTTDLIKVEIKIDGEPVSDETSIVSVTVHKSLYKISNAKIEISDGNISDAEFSTIENKNYEHGKEVEINLGYHNSTEIIFKGIIVKHSLRIVSENTSSIILECADKAIKATGQRKFKYFTDQKDSDIIRQLISPYSLQSDIEATIPTHRTIIQHNISDWDMLITRAQANQLVVFTDNGKVVAKKPTAGRTSVELTFGESIIDMDLSIDGRDQLKEVTVKAWDSSTHKMVESSGSELAVLDKPGKFKGKDIAGKLSFQKSEIHSTGKMKREELKAWADSTLMFSRLSRIKGTIKCQGFKINPLDKAKLASLGAYYDGDAFITGVFHEVKDGNWVTEIEVGLDPEIFITKKPDVTLPLANGLTPGVHGLFIGVVKKISGDPDNEHRVQITIPMIDGAQGDGVWARVSNVMASKDFGSFFMPEIGDEVVVGALGGDIRFPIILGHLYSSKHKYDDHLIERHDDNNHQKGFVTRSKLLLHFDDNDKIIRVETPGKQKIKLDDKERSITFEDVHKNKIVMDSAGIKITTMKDFVVDAQGKVEQKAMMTFKIDATGTLEASSKASAKLSAMGSTTIESQGMCKVSAMGMLELKATGIASLTGSLVKIN